MCKKSEKKCTGVIIFRNRRIVDTMVRDMIMINLYAPNI